MLFHGGLRFELNGPKGFPSNPLVLNPTFGERVAEG